MSNQGYYGGGQPQYPQYPQQSYGQNQGYNQGPPMQYQQPQQPQVQYVERKQKSRGCLGAW
ncbi:MAG: hypothetical protein M1825_002314 [Sarcosagium campestre]|nr:MAG: hypothetical protein M1825_002314 [Sarcosagium campestre]